MRHQKYTDHSAQNQQNETAQKILESASALFMQKGYKSVTTRDIADAAGVNLGLIPYYYSTKLNLARIACRNLMEGLDSRFFPELQSLPAAERMFLSSVFSWKYIDKDPEFSKFYYELIESTTVMDYTPYTVSFIADSWQVISHYNLQVTEAENSLYLMVMQGTEYPLILKRYHKELSLSQEDIVEILVSHYFFDIGLPDQEIARIIAFCRAYCGEHPIA